MYSLTPRLSLLADKKAAAHLKTVLGMVDEAAEGEGEGDGVEFLLHDGAHGPVRVHRAAEREPCPRQVNLEIAFIMEAEAVLRNRNFLP